MTNTNDALAAHLGSFVVAIIAGMMFLWGITFLAEVVSVKVKPMLPFVIVSAFVGFAVLKAFN